MSLKISRILHAGYVFEHDQTVIVFDPIFENPFSQNCYSYPAVEFDLEQIQKQKIDAVFISHYHDDHFSLESLKHLNRQTPIYMFCIFDQMFDLLKQLGFENVHSLHLNQAVQIKSFEIICHSALDIDVDSLFQIKAAGLNILNVVDSWIDDETMAHLEKQKPWDLILWPFQMMREIETLAPSRSKPWDKEWPIEWKEQLQKLQPKYVVPSSCQFIFESWSWLNQAFFPVTYKQFENEMRLLLPLTKVIRLDPSETVILNQQGLQKTESLSWVRLLNDQVVDYNYDPAITPPKTSQIATYFSALTAEQTAIVSDYCTFGIIQKYQSMEALDEVYFQTPRIWKLVIYDHLGLASHFLYQIQNNQIRLCDFEEAQVAWLTEIPSAKLYSALVDGESLTSLYVRINDCIFDPGIESEIQNVDIMFDPLLRCLYHGAVASYQNAQFRRISVKES